MNSASVAVVLVFFICWTPFHAQRLMFVIVTLQGEWTNANGQAHHILFLASGLSLLIYFPCILTTQKNSKAHRLNTIYVNVVCVYLPTVTAIRMYSETFSVKLRKKV